MTEVEELVEVIRNIQANTIDLAPEYQNRYIERIAELCEGALAEYPESDDEEEGESPCN